MKRLMSSMTVGCLALSGWAAIASTDAVPATQPVAIPASQPASQPATQPTTRPMLVQMFHGAPGHWCQVCAAAAARKAEQGRSSGDAVAPSDPSSTGDLITDLPPR